MRVLSVLAFSALVALATASPASAEAMFMGLGDLPGGSTISLAQDVSDDGSVVVGSSYPQAFRWENGVLTGLGSLPGDESASAHGVSADGSIVVGMSGPYGEAFRWENGVMIGLGTFPGLGVLRVAWDVSADGSVIVGYAALGTAQAFRWENGVATGLGDLPGGDFFSEAFAVSADGSIVVGHSYSASGDEAFRWENGVMMGLGDLPGGDFDSEATAISPDGAVIAGSSSSDLGFQAFRWKNGLMTALPLLPGASLAKPTGVSRNGLVIVGRTELSEVEAFIWDSANGMRNLQDVLVNDFGLDLTGWNLDVAEAISPDGSVIVGWGDSPSGHREGWIAVISPVCSDGIDNDGDGLADFPDDPGCGAADDLSEKSPALSCDDGFDNDGDGLIDYPDDPGCATPGLPAVEDPECTDGADNDGDTYTDFPDDPGCFNASAPSETTACDDGLDNDGDGYCDMPTSTCIEPGVTPGDPWCDAGWDDSEATWTWECGLGFELALLLPPLMWLRGWRRRRS